MRNPNRIDRILSLIKEKWLTVPDQRFGQFIINYFTDYINFYVEDEKLEDWLRGEGYNQLTELGVKPTWTSYYDKNNKRLKKPTTKYVTELTDDHILAIIDFCFKQNRVPMDVIRVAAERKILSELLKTLPKNF